MATTTIDTNTLILTEAEVKNLLDMKDVLQVVETAFKEKGNGNVQMPPKTYLTYPTFQGDLRVMPCYLPGLSISGVKIVNVHPNNSQYSIPTVMAAVILVDVATGIPKSIMGGTWLTAMRTGAASAVATKYLSKKNAKTLGLVGAGVQAISQTLGILQVRQIEEIFASSMHEGPLKNYLNAMEQYGITGRVKINVVKEPREAVENIDIVCTTTPARKPAIDSEWVTNGTHINA
ncbi:ornithine cyclodeaminase family protein, partial [Candidatus Micrarchaeota archaeon]|nr:ornithine cyclodeaminase family protein [Candidatus Micrarchaeota archaeon]